MIKCIQWVHCKSLWEFMHYALSKNPISASSQTTNKTVLKLQSKLYVLYVNCFPHYWACAFYGNIVHILDLIDNFD